MLEEHRPLLTWKMLLRAWSRDWGGLLTAVSVLYVVLCFLWLLFPWGSVTDQGFIGSAIFLPIGLVVITLAWRASTHPLLPTQAGRAWRIVALAYVALWLGNALNFYYIFTLGANPFPSFADVAYLAFYPILLWALLTFPVALPSATVRATLWLDAGTILLGGGMVVWHFVLRPHVAAGYEGPLLLATTLAYPVCDLLVIFGLATVALRKPQASSRHALTILLLGGLSNTVAGVGYGSLLLQGTYTTTSWPNAFWMLAYLFMLVSAQVQYWHASHDARLSEPMSRDQPRLNPLPYVAITLGYGVLLFATRDIWATPVGSLIIGAVALTCLVVTRQITAVQAVQRARSEAEAAAAALEQVKINLEQRVAERTATLAHALATQEEQAQALQASLAVQQDLNQTIALLSVPILPVRDEILVVPLIGVIDSERAQLLLDNLLQRVEAVGARYVCIDVTGVVAIDQHVAAALLNIAAATRLLGAESMLVGIRPDVAQALAAIGSDVQRLRTAATLQQGLAQLERYLERGFSHN